MQTFSRAPFPDNEERRLATLDDYALLDSPGEALFDSLAALAAQLCAAPIALITLIDRDRQWFKANIGFDGMRETTRDISLCAHVILNEGLTEIPDTLADERFAANPLVQGTPFMRFYAGIPLTVAGGQTLGTLCVIDREPRSLSAQQRAALTSIAATIVDQFELRRAQLRLLDGSTAEFFEIEPHGQRLRFTSDVTRRKLGFSLEEAQVLTLADVLPELAAPGEFDRHLGQLRAGVHAPPIRTYLRGNAGGTHPVDVRFELIRLAGNELLIACATDATASDVVARGSSLESLNDRLTTLTEVARDLFASLDPHGLVDALARGVAQLTGGGTARVLARGTGDEFIETRDLLSKAQTSVASDEFVRASAGHEGVTLRPDGRRAVVPILAPSGMTAYLIDISAGERPFVASDAFAFGLLGQYLAVAVRNVELYGELASRRAAVIELNQVKNDLIAMLAHDFKGPLTTIVGLADVLAEDERFDAESRQLLGMINSSAMRLASLASDTLALSRLEQNELTLRFDRVDMVALVRDIVRVLGVTRVIDMRVTSDVMVVRADAARLRQVFENVIGNAIKYSPRGETVDVLLREKRGGVEVAIRDRGIGIPVADLPKLFGRFARGSNAREMGIGGTGFGLYLSRTIVEMHGGRIAVESTVGAGSTFRIFVPTVPAPQRTLDRRVLLLDNEEHGRSFIAHTLRDEGYAVYPVTNEAELLAALDDGRYDAAIVDVDRLTIGADELLERIAHRTTLVRLVSTVESESTGWNAALCKPFLIKDLAVVLESAVAERRRSPRRPLD